jgi:phosphatidylserine decarboxylase
VLSDDAHKGWFGKDAMETMPNFAEEFECDPSAPHYGFNSWDDFFGRKFREGVRPVEDPDDDNVVANACESAPYRLAYNVKNQDIFWIKKCPYSLGRRNIYIVLLLSIILEYFDQPSSTCSTIESQTYC